MSFVKKMVPMFLVSVIVILALCGNTLFGRTLLFTDFIIWTAIFLFGNQDYFIKKIAEYRQKKHGRQIQQRKKEKEPDAAPPIVLEAEAALHQLEERITELLRIAYPNASWEWECESPLDLAILGGHGQIVLQNAGEFGRADILLDETAHLQFRLLRITPLMDIIRQSAPANVLAKPEVSDSEDEMDVQAWFDLQGAAALAKIVTELNTNGHDQMLISEGGDIYTEKNGIAEKQAKLEGFPAPKFWGKLITAFAAEKMQADIQNGRLHLCWDKSV